jgi:hypothetical protein
MNLIQPFTRSRTIKPDPMLAFTRKHQVVLVAAQVEEQPRSADTSNV